MQNGSPVLTRLDHGPQYPACKWRSQPTYRGCPYPSTVSRAGVRGEFDPHGTVRPSHSPGANLHRGLGVTNPGNNVDRFRNFRNGSRIRTQLGSRQRDRLRASEQFVDSRIDLLKAMPPILTRYSNTVRAYDSGEILAKPSAWRVHAMFCFVLFCFVSELDFYNK